KEMTIQAWGRVDDGGCAPLVSSGRSMSYWMGLCETLQFGYSGASTATSGRIPLRDGWHNVAVTMDDDGLRKLYVDGQLDVQPGWNSVDWPIHKEPELSARLGRSDEALFIGGGSDVQAGGATLHAYVRDLAVWNRVLDVSELRATALQKLTGRELGLVALWPFTNGLQD